MKRTKQLNRRKITFNAPATLTFGIICLISFLLGQMTSERSTHLLFMTYRSSLMTPMTWVRFFTHVCGHANWSHLIGNMSYILLLGPLLEEKYGSGKIVRIIFVTAFVTGIINYAFFPMSGLLGASGVVFAFILLSSFTSFKDGEIPVTFILVAFIYLGQQVYDGIFVQDNVANFAHIIGGLVGAVVGFSTKKEKSY